MDDGLRWLFLAAVFLGPVIYRAIRKSMEEGEIEQQIRSHVKEATEKGLAVSCTRDTIEAEDGTSYPVIRVQVSGAILAPRDNQPGAFRVRLSDITDGEDEPSPIFCSISDLSDEDGIYEADQKLEIPYRMSTVDDMGITGIPLFALVPPHKGRRKLQVIVAVTAEDDLEQMFAFGKTTFSHDFDCVGYLEMHAHTMEQERRVAMLALAMSAADGHVDRREMTVIRRFFSESLAGRTDEQERKGRVSEILRETLEAIKSGDKNPDSMIRSLCAEICDANDSAVAQTAYDLCVQVVAADDAVEEEEHSALRLVASELRLPDGFVREVHDRNLRLAMFDEAEEESLVGVPAGLSHEGKLEFLNGEYRKWRTRVTHSDASVAAEASLRLERITKLRRELTDGHKRV